MMDSDNELIARTRAGDLSAFESLFHKYQNQIYRCPVGAVKSRLHYARKALKRRFEKNRRLVRKVVYEPA